MKWLRPLLMLGVWAVVLAAGLAGVELYARKQRGNANFYELDRLKVYNRRFYEQRRSLFRDWPIPLELFDADKPTPRYLFKPNLRMAVRGSRLEPAAPGEQVVRSTNSWGFRGPEFSVKNPPGVIRIVCLGASTTEGSQGDLETYPHFLQQELNRLFVGKQIEVLNAGHHGQQTDDLLEILRQRVLPLDPDIVIFYEAANDISWREFTRVDLSCDPASCLQKGYQGAFALLYRHSLTFKRLRQYFGWRFPGGRPLWHRFDDVSLKPGAVRYRSALQQIVRETLDHKSRIVLASFVTLAHEDLTVRREGQPLLFDDIYVKRHPFAPGEMERVFDYYNRIIREVAAEYRVPFVDTARLFPRDPKYFPYDIIHFSPDGNKILAGILAAGLKERGLLDFPQRDLRR